jgi:hypothetical protein
MENSNANHAPTWLAGGSSRRFVSSGGMHDSGDGSLDMRKIVFRIAAIHFPAWRS